MELVEALKANEAISMGAEEFFKRMPRDDQDVASPGCIEVAKDLGLTEEEGQEVMRRFLSWAAGGVSVEAARQEPAASMISVGAFYGYMARLRQEQGEGAKGLSWLDINELVYQAAGAATAVLLSDLPGYVFPSERVAAAVKSVMEEFGVPPGGEGPIDERWASRGTGDGDGGGS